MIAEILEQLNKAKAVERKKALQAISQATLEVRQEARIIKAVLAGLTDPSVLVQREAVRTISFLGLREVPAELKILFHTTTDAKLKNLALSTLRRLELEAERRQAGEIEWNLKDYVFSVGDFISYLNALLGQEVVQIKGEVSDVSTFRESLVFFSLKDAEAVVHCWFPRAYQYKWGVELQTGLEIVVKVKPQVSPKSGRFALRVLEMSLSGEGSLKLALEKLKGRLAAEGLFALERKRPLPWFPQTIGLITGENSAAYSDFIKVLQARLGGLTIYFAPVRVQGVGSIAEISGAIKYFNQKKDLAIDLIVLTRGGGSLEDLQSFNSEEVTRAVFSSVLPIVVAVGHEKDWSLADLAADLRASTPSNAAELIVPYRENLSDSVDSWVKISQQHIYRIIQRAKQVVFQGLTIINHGLKQRLSYYHNVLSSLKIYFQQFSQIYQQKRLLIANLEANLLSNLQNYYKLKGQKFSGVYKLLLSYSPRHTLKRGYSVVKLREEIVKSARQVKKGDEIEVWPYEGVIISKVKSQNSRQSP